jgi:hypothetical protein
MEEDLSLAGSPVGNGHSGARAPASAVLRRGIDLALIAAAALAGPALAAAAGGTAVRGAALAYVPVAFGLGLAAEVTLPPAPRGRLGWLAPVVEGTALAAMLVLAVALLVGEPNPGPTLAVTWLLSVALVGAGRAILPLVMRAGETQPQSALAARSGEQETRPALVVGPGEDARTVADWLERRPVTGLRPTRVLDRRFDNASSVGPALARAAADAGAEHVVLVLDAPPTPALAATTRECRERGLSVSVAAAPRAYEFRGGLTRLARECEELGIETSFVRPVA